MSTWQGICAPRDTPPAIVAALSSAVAQAARSADFAERLAALGAQAVGSSPEEFLVFVKSEIPRWPKGIRNSGAKAQ